MKHESTCVEVDGLFVLCNVKTIGDHWRYYTKNFEFSFCSVDKPDEHGNHIARTCNSQLKLGNDFSHEEVVRWALETIKEKDIDFYCQLTFNPKEFREFNIRKFAKIKWEEAGKPEGRDEEFWLTAEKEYNKKFRKVR